MVNTPLVNCLIDVANAARLETTPLVLALATAAARVAERRGLALATLVAFVSAAYRASAHVGDDDVPVASEPAEVTR